MIKFLISACAFVALAYSPLTLADQATSTAKSNDEIQKYMAYEGNETLQGLVRAKYGISISGLLEFFSREDDTNTNVPGAYDDTPEWLPKLIVHLVNEEYVKSNKTLKLTQNLYIDELYAEFNVEIETMKLHDTVRWFNTNSPRAFAHYRELRNRTDNLTLSGLRPFIPLHIGSIIYCTGVFHINGTKHVVYSEAIPLVFQTVMTAELEGENGPWVWPSAPVIMYNKPILVKLVCWAWMELNGTLTWYIIQGNNKDEIVTVKMDYIGNSVKLELYKTFDSSHNGSVIMCDANVTPSRKKYYAISRNITLLYHEHIDDECTNVVMLGWGILALLVLSEMLALATYIVLVAIRPVKKSLKKDRRLPNA